MGIRKTRIMNRLIPLSLIWASLLLISCENDSAPGSAICITSPDTLDFGFTGTPPFGWVEDLLIRDIMISNEGRALLCGEIIINVEPTGPRLALFRLYPAQTDPTFCLSPGESITFQISVSMENASEGDYAGTLDLGTLCEPVPIFMKALPSQ